MAIFEIEDSQIDQLRALGAPVTDRTAEFQRAREHELFIANASKDPKKRDKVLELLAADGQYIPELERVKEVRTEFDQKLDERLRPLDEFLKKQSEREEQSKTDSIQKLVNDGRSYLREQGWDDEGVSEVEQFMRDNSVGSYRVASEHLKRQKPNPAPLPTSTWNGNNLGNSWFTPPDDAPDHKLLLQNPNAFAQREVAKFLNEKHNGTLKL